MTTMTYARRLLACLPILALAGGPAGCLFVADPAPGDLTFLWSFAGEPDCIEARVAEVDVFIRNSGGTVVRELTRVECAGGGLTVEELAVGDYTVQVDAYSLRGRLLYEGQKDATVTSGEVADMGIIELSRAGEPTTGDLAFYWSFDGEATCEAAGVDEVDIELIDDSGETVLSASEECYGGGLVLEELAPGELTIFVDAFTSDDLHLFTGSAAATIQAGETTDIGVLELDPVDAQEEAGTLRLDLGFVYPASDVDTDCGRTGVEEIDLVLIDGPGGEELQRTTFTCDGDGVGIDVTLDPGTHHFYLEAYGLYDEDWLLLYDTADLEETVSEGMVTDLGLVALDRVSGNFADIRFETSLPMGETCASLGLDMLSYTITRLGDGEVLDDEGELACTSTFLLRETFVPGDYRVDVSGEGDAGTYQGSATLDAAPDTQADAEVALSLVD